MNRFLILIITIMTLCFVSCEDSKDSKAQTYFVETIRQAEKIVSETSEGTNKGDIAPGSKATLQARIDWAYFILENSSTDEAFTNAGVLLKEAISSFYGNVVKEGSPLFGAGSKIDLGPSGEWGLGDSFTVECKVYYTKLENGDQNIISCEGGSGGWMLRNSGKVIQFYINDGGWSGCGTPALDENRWYHIAATYSSGKGLVLYVNGVQVSASNCGKLKYDPAIHLQVGTAPSYANRYMRGYIQHLSLWTDVRTAGEVSTDVAGNFLGTEDKLSAYWPLTLNVGTTVTDKTGNHTVQLSGITWMEPVE